MQDYGKMMRQKRILLVHLISMGDCLYVTAVARQIKHDYPGCYLTWAISSRCSDIIKNNPYVDEIWEVFCETLDSCWGPVWETTKKEALERKEKGIYDDIFFTQLYPDNLSHYDGTIRSSTFRGYPNPITVPVEPVILLTEKEVENVNKFAIRYKLDEFKMVILFESSPGSGQSPINNSFALTISRQIVARFEEAVVIITSDQVINTGHDRVIDASPLTFRENAELSKYCNLLIGGSSGITWLLTSTWAKKNIPTIQILNKRSLIFQFASVSYDLNYWGQSTDHIVEVTKFDDEYIFSCIVMALQEGIAKAHTQYHEKLKPSRESFIRVIIRLIFTKKFTKIIEVSRNFYERNGDILIVILVPYAVVTAMIKLPLYINKHIESIKSTNRKN